MGIADLPRPVGYVLGGGGSLGAVQVGMLQALSEHAVAPDIVAGTSVGSLNGAVVALDPASAANRLSHLWARLQLRHCHRYRNHHCGHNPGPWLAGRR